MQPETATLLAMVAAPLAVLAAVLAIVVVRMARRGRRELGRTTERLASQEAVIRDQLRDVRAAADATTMLLTRVREEADRLDTGVTTWTATLRGARQDLERLTTGRVGPMVRMMQVAGALARVALLWRAPVR